MGTHTFRYAVLPHAHGWQAGGVVQAALTFNQPLVMLPPLSKTAAAAGSNIAGEEVGVVQGALALNQPLVMLPPQQKTAEAVGSNNGGGIGVEGGDGRGGGVRGGGGGGGAACSGNGGGGLLEGLGALRMLSTPLIQASCVRCLLHWLVGWLGWSVGCLVD